MRFLFYFFKMICFPARFVDNRLCLSDTFKESFFIESEMYQFYDPEDIEREKGEDVKVSGKCLT